MANARGMKPIGVEVADNNSTRLDYGTGGLLYVGIADVGSGSNDPVWQIRQITYVNSQLAVFFANGSDAYDQVWDDRANLTYV